ncbi:MAG: hypothetical protein IJZ88_04910 [Clostridia bacterium]|nr:hypothetical protein [Clostridia bacterium]
MEENKVVENVESASAESNSKSDFIATIIKCVAAILCVAVLMVTLSQCVTKVSENNIKIAEFAASSNGGSVSVDSGSYDDGSSYVDSDVAVDGDVPADDSVSTDAPVADDSTGDASTDAPAASTPAGNAGASTGSKKPSTKAEIVDYFNKAVNGVKTGAKAVEQKGVTNYLAGTTTIPSGIQGIYKMLGGDDWLDETLKKNGHGAETHTGDAIKARFPVEGEAYASKLTANDVTNATCTESNGVYTIKITTVADGKSDSVKHGEGHAPKAFNVILPGTINDNIPGPAVSLVGKASMNYPSSTATITVDVATGHVLTADYDLKWTINFDKMGIVLPFGTKSVYTIKW